MKKLYNKQTKETRERERESNQLVVWALYDDANSSYKKAIAQINNSNNSKIEVHSIGINDVKFEKSNLYFYHRIDLSLMNFNLIKDLSSLPKPDIILASPPCESWSSADCNGKMFRGFDTSGAWRVMNAHYYEEYCKTCHPVKRRYFEQKERGRLIGESTIGGTIEIIKHFKPKVWVIENPKTSKSWEFQELHWNFEGFKNITNYSSYDSKFSLKPTIFKSNIKLNLLNNKVESNNDHMAKGSYTKRSSIPLNLIEDIMKQIKSWIDGDK
ncbi:cytosine methyltransferase [Metamycoplasma hyosynoviae]|uniref:cytosine methyltransferase n=2 Tax=Metamycoplasma hyosynoviae TaxID=29559 RepID=UPI002360A5EA|nr:cytosine methyltransferase [Metamycoplasma hyosynoviae]MDD1372474.1 cytosine methyltransferase [Metamycoplasma hyosynoviae]